MEQYGLLIIFALIALAQVLFRWLRGRAQQPRQQQRQQGAPTPVTGPPRHREEERKALPSFARMRAPASEPAPTVTPFTPPARRAAAPPRLLTSHTELRRAIVLMEVLGPCRGSRPMTRPRGD
jgi:hypothetical protein